MSAETSIQFVSATNSALAPIPISTSRKPSTPPRQARTYTAAAVHRAPHSAARGNPSAPSIPASVPEPAATMSATAAALAPAVTPRMSGLASGLRDAVWVRAPATASAAPTSTAARPRGRRSSRTMNRSSCSPPPASTETTCGTDSG